MANKDPKNKFSKDKQPGERKPRGKAKRTLYIEALMEELDFDPGKECSSEDSEKEYYKFCIKVGMGRHQYMEESQEGRDVVFGKPDAQLLKDGMARLFPLSKSTFPTYEFEFPEGGTILEKADAIMKAFADGVIPIDAANQAFGILTDRALIEEKHELADRVAKIEQLLEGDTNGNG